MPNDPELDAGVTDFLKMKFFAGEEVFFRAGWL